VWRGAALHQLDREIPIELNALLARSLPSVFERGCSGTANGWKTSLSAAQIQSRHQIAKRLIRPWPTGGVGEIGIVEI
jgi:hypothetical protein